MTRRTTRLVLDDIFLCWADSGVARLWRGVVNEWERSGLPDAVGVEVTVLDRSGRLAVPGLSSVPFPSRTWDDTLHAADRRTLDHVCASVGADVFVSTYSTFPLQVPSLTMVYDLIPELFGFATSDHRWLERRLSLAVGRRFLAISESTRSDLCRLYPWVDPANVAVAHPGIDHSLFVRADADIIHAFRATHDLDRDYIVLPGTRSGKADYKNGRAFFEMIRDTRRLDCDLVLTGEEAATDEELEACAAADMKCLQLRLTDSEYVACLSGARAVVYPSLHEGFGLPPLESLAVGTPVVTSGSTSLRESTGDLAVCFTAGSAGMRGALDSAMSADWTEKIRFEGPAWARRFTWGPMARAVLEHAVVAADEQTPLSDPVIGAVLADYQDVSLRLQ